MYFKQKGDKSHALVEFLKATQENPRLTRAFYEQALIFRERGYLKLAQSALEQALALKPDYHEGRMLLATIQIQQGNVGGAMQQLGQSLGISVAPKSQTNEQDELPQPAVLQSLHTLLPENIASGIAGLTVGKTNGSARGNGKSGRRSEQKAASRRSRKNTPPKNESTQQDTVQIVEPKSGESAVDSMLTHLPNPLHMFFSNNKGNELPEGDKSDEVKTATVNGSTENSSKSGKKKETVESADLDPANLPELPPPEKHADATDGAKADKKQKRAKKSWFSRIMTALDSTQDEENPAPHAPPPIVADDEPKPGDAIVKSIPPLKPEALVTAPPSLVPPSVTALTSAAPAMMPIPGMPNQVETFEKPDQPRQIIEKVTAMANAAISNVAKTNFQFPNLANLNSGMFNAHGGSDPAHNEPPSLVPPEEAKQYKPVIAPNSDDPWSVRLRYLADHGTGTLKEGEAFMFSEETGEATLFLSDGQTVRRTIYLPRDAQEVVKQRRPDILTPDDLLYNLSLLAKLMPKASESEPPPSNTTSTQKTTGQPAFEVNDLMGKSQRFWGWMKDALKL